MNNVAKIIQEFLDVANKSNADINKQNLTTTTIAIVVAYQLPIPSSEVINYKEWYLLNCHQIVEKHTSEINELIVVNFEDVLTIAKTIWTYRYLSVHDASRVLGCLLNVLDNKEIAPVYLDAIKSISANEYVYLVDKITKGIKENA